MRSIAMALMMIGALTIPAAAQKGKGRGSGKKNKPKPGYWHAGIPYSTDAAAAIRSVRKSGKMLAIYVGDRNGGTTQECKRLWQSLRAVTNGRSMDRLYYDMHIGDSESFHQTWVAHFTWLNVYPKKVAGATQLGPFGVRGFKFKPDRNGQFLIYRYNGERISASPRSHKDAKQRTYQILELLCKACEQHGPIVRPKLLEPLVKDYDKGLEHQKRRRIGAAYGRFAAVIEACKDSKTFPDQPMVAQRAKRRIDEIVERAATELAGAKRAKTPAERQAALTALQKKYVGVPPVLTEIEAALGSG